ncbi:MAG: MBL fold metallo-hydrolase [Spirochaetales bacterium]|nr:MBL fold metallo-hydrolase [Spirochaetales bacterium]
MDRNGLRQLGPHTWVMEGPTNIGFIETDQGIVLVDSGNDKECGRKINAILRDRGWKLDAVINTHANADHIGGNDYLQRNLGCRIYAPEQENAFTEYPRLEAAFLWGGMEPKDLRNKFFLAKPSMVSGIIDHAARINDSISTFPLPGHYFNMCGVETADNVLFIADCIFGKQVLAKYRIPFIFDVQAYRSTIETVRRMKALCYVPSHGDICTDISGLAQINLAVVDRLEQNILDILAERKTHEAVLKETCDRYGIRLDCGQYALVGSTVRSFLSYLYNAARIQYEFDGNYMYWRHE